MRRLLFVVLASCSAAPPPPTTSSVPMPTNPNPQDTPRTIHPITNIVVSSGDLDPPFSPDIHEYEISSLTTIAPVTITVSGQDTWVDGRAALDGVPKTLMLSQLEDDVAIRIVGKLTSGADDTYTIHTVPQDRPRYTVNVVDNPKPGNIFFAPFPVYGSVNRPSFLYVLDAYGDLAFYRKLTMVGFDFKKHLLADGTTRYTYMETDNGTTTGMFNQSTVHVLDEQFRDIAKHRLLMNNDHTEYGADVHDFMLLGDDHWITLSYYPKTVTNVPNVPTAKVVAAIVQEVKNGQVVFEWDSTSDPSLYVESGFTFGASAYADYAHVNSMALDPTDGNLVLSVRHTDEIISISRITGNIVWKLGGAGDHFNLPSDQRFLHQHCASFIGPNQILLFDNGNGTNLTKIREVTFDPFLQTASATSFSVDKHYSFAMGSVQKINGSYFIGWGYRGQTETADITEIDPMTNQKSFELLLEAGYLSYRAFKN